MDTKKTAICLIIAVAMLCVTLPAAKAASDAESAQTQRLVALKKSDPNNVSLAVMPMKLWSRPPMANPGILADLLGLVLESHGMNNIDALDTEFAPPPDMAWEEIPSRLAELLKKNPTKNKYVLFVQCLGDWNSGPNEIRFVVTDAVGNLVLADSQTSKDEDFKRIVAADPDPMGFSALVAERLFTLLGWKKNEGEPHGKFARKWAQMSGMPSDEEKASMEKSFAKFRANVKTTQIAVYPTFVNQKSDAQSAADLASLIAQQIGCKTIKIDKEVPFQRQPTGNEQKLLWDLARAFRDYLRSNPPDADYAVLAEYYVNPDGKQANAVHFVICDKSGGWVLADFQNSTHEDFKTIAPKSVKDCDRLAVQRLAKRLIIPEAAAEARANPKKAPDSEACTAIANTAPAVSVTTGDATVPTGTGGTVEDGTYYLTALVRTPASIIPQIQFRQTIRISGNTLEMTAENSNKPAFTSVRTFTTSGSSIVFARVCSTDVGMQTETQFNSYTADATHFSLYSIGLGITVTYTKQPSE